MEWLATLTPEQREALLHWATTHAAEDVKKDKERIKEQNFSGQASQAKSQ